MPPGACTAYSAVNPETAATAVKSASFVLHVLGDWEITGAGGNITTFTVLLVAHAPVPAVFAGVLPHATASTYLAVIE